MGGETPGAKRAGQEKKTGKRLKFADDKNTNKYYASGQPSVINNTPADTRGPIDAVPKANNVSLGKMDERSADKKYYATRVPDGTKPVARHLLKAAERAANPSERLQQATSSLTIRSASEVGPVMDEVVRRLSEIGEETLLVVNTVAGVVLRRARTKLDSLVTRQLITEDQSRQVRFSAIEEPAAVTDTPPPVPAEATRTEDIDAELDIDAILSGESPIEDEVDTSPQNIQEEEFEDDTDDYTPPGGGAVEEEEEEVVDPLDPAAPELTESPTEESSPAVSDATEDEDDVDEEEEPEDEE